MLSPLSRSVAVTDKDFMPLQVLQLFSEECARLAPIIGTGSPEDIHEAQVGREYLNTIGAPGAVKYAKVLADIGGNRKMGWVAI